MLKTQDPHALVASTCVACLIQYGFHDTDLGSDLSDGERTMDRMFDQHALLRYAHEHWSLHAHKSKSSPHPIVDFVQQCERYPLVFYGTLDTLNPLQTAAAYNFPMLVQMLLSSYQRGAESSATPSKPTIDINARSPQRASTAICLAAALGHIEVVETLIRVEGELLIEDMFRLDLMD